ncbi:MAG: RNA-binding transcriptional accessory protein [Paludibacteraceae bacterium]|nr:RNA-binding transcriptional accessory protein [Paludibacteraceae bacterium]
MESNFAHIISRGVSIGERQVAATMALLDEGATIPFIARYRKEKTGSLDEVQIAAIQAQYGKLQELDKRKETILARLDELGNEDKELRARITDCWDATELEDIYLPYKPHRKTRADIAIEKGLLPLAEEILKQRPMRLPGNEEELQGARDIIAQRIAEDEKSRNAIRREFSYTAMLKTSPRPSPKEREAEQANYKDYFYFTCPLKHIKSHQLLAIRRAETEGFLRVDISPDTEKALDKLAHIWLRANNDTAYQVELAMEDSYKRLLKPGIETEFAALSKEKADQEAIRVFADNLRQLLLGAPLGQKRVLALDPGFRTGCKTVVLNEQGDLITHDVIYLHNLQSTKRLQELIEQYRIEAIAIGNGTASRETEEMARTIVESLKSKGKSFPQIFVVSEAGASVYSASKTAREEFPDEDVTVRGAVSIGRRLIDPLAELVKIEPKSIGVGQYQHDVDQTALRESLQQTVESVVNYVGVDVNTASKHLLTYISGLGPALAQNIVDYRAEHGAFQSRKELLKVPKLGNKTFEQAAGFLRLKGANPLDNSAVHPESYGIVEKMAKDQGCSVAELIADKERQGKIDLNRYVSAEAGLPTLTDILNELAQPGRDPRGETEEFHFDGHVHTIDDLQEGMVLPGIVTNISAFGAFVDVGVHKDGLIHISEMADRRVSSPHEVVKLHQHVRVRVTNVDRERGRIQLSLKGIKN